MEAENQEVKKNSLDFSIVQVSQNGKDLTKVPAQNGINGLVSAGGVENKAFVVEDSDRL